MNEVNGEYARWGRAAVRRSTVRVRRVQLVWTEQALFDRNVMK
jgi:hypothetical protein